VIARFSKVANCIFHFLEADSISKALTRPKRHITVTLLISDTPRVSYMPITEDVLLAVLNIDDNKFYLLFAFR